MTIPTQTGRAPGRRGALSRRKTLAAVATAAVLTLLAAGSAGPDPLAERAAQFDNAYAAFQGWYTGERDERGTSYAHWRYRDHATGTVRTIDTETDYARRGRGTDIALLRRDRLSRPGFSLDYLHEPGSPVDLVLLGDRYRHPGPGWAGEPSAWLARPTTLADVGGWSPCATGGTALFCPLDAAVAATRAAVPAVPRTAQRQPDGTITAQTGVRLLDLIAHDLTPLGATQLTALQPILTALVPLTITIGPDGTLVRAELNAELTTPAATLELQLGLEHLGVATAADFPAPPNEAEIRHVDRLEYVFLLQDALDYATREAAAEAPR